jgi:hypothetical protein
MAEHSVLSSSKPRAAAAPASRHGSVSIKDWPAAEEKIPLQFCQMKSRTTELVVGKIEYRSILLPALQSGVDPNAQVSFSRSTNLQSTASAETKIWIHIVRCRASPFPLAS